MYNFKVKFALLSIRSKIITAFLFGCIVVAFAWVIARIVFKETFTTIDLIAKPNPKLVIINTLFQKIQRLDYSQKTQVLKLQDKFYAPVLDESKPIINLLDTLNIYCAGDTLQARKIQRMQNILYERDELFFNYLKFRYGLLKNNPLSKDIHNLSEYISRNIKKGDSSVVKKIKKNTTTTTILDAENAQKKADKKEPFFKRVFNRKKNKEVPLQPSRKLITEDVEETIDTLAVTQRDSFMKDMERAISSIEKDRFNRRTKLMNQELKLVAASTIFIDELEQLLRQVQSEEIRDLQNNTESLSSVFNNAFNWVEIILCAFLVLILTLIFLIFSDISQSNLIRLQLIEAKEKAEHLEKVKHRFLANMSHEIRTPLQAIIGYSEQVKDQDKPEKHSLEAIYRSSEHLLQIVNEVLDYSRIISGKFIFEKKDFDMSEVVAEIADILEGQAEKKNILFKIKSEISYSDLYSGDAFRLKQILFNLLGNAIKFTDHGEVNFLITSKEISPKKTEFTFEIKDTGIGMTEEELKRIFNMFEQAEETTQRLYGGTGLGLSIAKMLVVMQGGILEVTSKKNKGSVFKVVMCYLKAARKSEKQNVPFLLNENFKPGKVLVVDDDEFILQLCSTLLSKHNIAHICFSSSEKVMQELWDDSVTTVMLDIRMPVISGIELFRFLKKKAKPETKFIALTAQALPDEKNAVLKQGFDQVLLKPFREKDILQVLADTATQENPLVPLKENRFDLSSLEAMCMHDKVQLKKMLNLLARETRTDLNMMIGAAEINDLKGIAETSHKLASKVGQVGLHYLSHNLNNLEAEARENKKNIFEKNKLSEIIKEIKDVIEKIESYSV